MTVPVEPQPTTRPNSLGGPASASDGWRIERIGIELMTAEQYETAVTALAVLIVRWRLLPGSNGAHDEAA